MLIAPLSHVERGAFCVLSTKIKYSRRQIILFDLTIIRQNGGCYIDSREVAEIIGKPHNDLMKAIRKYCDHLTEGSFSLSDFFISSSYLDSTGRTLPCFLLSKMGCEMIANKLTGKKGVLFTAVYVAKFNQMEAAERAAISVPTLRAPRLGEYNAAARIIIHAMQNMGAAPERIIGFLKGIYEPLGIAVTSDDSELSENPRTYSAKQIAKMYGVYSLNGNPHSQAVACILNENLFIGEKHRTVITTDYGSYIGVSIRYDQYAVQAVEDWIIENGYPSEIYGFERTYYVLYDFQLSK